MRLNKLWQCCKCKQKYISFVCCGDHPVQWWLICMATLHMIYSGHIHRFFLFQYTYPNRQATPAFLQYQHLSSLPWHSVTHKIMIMSRHSQTIQTTTTKASTFSVARLRKSTCGWKNKKKKCLSLLTLTTRCYKTVITCDHNTCLVNIRSSILVQ